MSTQPWRKWLARALISRWLADRHFYQLSVVQTEAENPEARIAEDGRYAIELLVDFSLGAALPADHERGTSAPAV